jgi:hypothetical protein
MGRQHQQRALAERVHRTLRRIVSENHSTGTAEVNTLLPQNLSDVSFTNATSTVGLQLLNLSLLEAMLRCLDDGVTTTKSGHQTTGNARVIWSDVSSFTPFPTSGRAYVWITSKEARFQQ